MSKKLRDRVRRALLPLTYPRGNKRHMWRLSGECAWCGYDAATFRRLRDELRVSIGCTGIYSAGEKR